MDRDNSSRRQKSSAASHSTLRPKNRATPPPRQETPPKRGLGSRVGLEKRDPEPRRSGKYRRAPSQRPAARPESRQAEPVRTEPRRPASRPEEDTIQYTLRHRTPRSSQTRRGGQSAQGSRAPSRGGAPQTTRSQPGNPSRQGTRPQPSQQTRQAQQTPGSARRPAPNGRQQSSSQAQDVVPPRRDRQTKRRPSPSGTNHNPQKATYRPGAPRHQRRVTQVEKMRIRRRRRVQSVLIVALLVLMGMALTVFLLFKVTNFRVENLDRTTPANTGIYTEEQIIDLLDIQVGDNIFSFFAGEKSRQLQQQLPYLDVVEVARQLPNTVVVKVQPATERFAVDTATGWLVLSDGLKVLRTSGDQPDGLILLDAAVDPNSPQSPGSYLVLQDTTPEATPESALAELEKSEEELGEDSSDTSAESETGDETTATPESADSRVNQTLTSLMEKLEEWQLLDKVTMISLRDLEEINFLYDGRVSVLLGTANNLDYKMRFASNLILDVDGRGLTSTDRGTLDVSYQRTDGSIAAYFEPAEPAATPTPSPEPSASGDGDAASGDTGDTSAGTDGGNT